MGTSATTDCAHIEFNSWDAAKAAFPLFKAFVKEAQEGKRGGDFGFDLESLHCASGQISFDASSGKVANLEWQLDKTLEFARTLEGITEFNAPVMIQGEGIYWTPHE